jgi:hypothetical protein
LDKLHEPDVQPSFDIHCQVLHIYGSQRHISVVSKWHNCRTAFVRVNWAQISASKGSAAGTQHWPLMHVNSIKLL